MQMKFTLLEVCQAFGGLHDIVFNAKKIVCICWSDQSNPRAGLNKIKARKRET